MIINKITVGWVTQIFDVDKKRFISQEFFAGDQVDYEQVDGVAVSTEYLEMDEKEIYHSFEMVQPGIRHIQLLESDGEQIGILKTNADESTLDELFNNYTAIESEDKGIDEFVAFCLDKYPDYFFEKFFLDEERILKI